MRLFVAIVNSNFLIVYRSDFWLLIWLTQNVVFQQPLTATGIGSSLKSNVKNQSTQRVNLLLYGLLEVQSFVIDKFPEK